jgi:hypothetical protein
MFLSQDCEDFFYTDIKVRLAYTVHLFIFSEDSELRRTLQSLACGKARVIMKTPKVYATAP